MPKQVHPLVGKTVSVSWRNPEADWNNYKVLHFEYPLIALQGIEQEGVEFKGGPIWVSFDSEIELLEELRDGS